MVEAFKAVNSERQEPWMDCMFTFRSQSMDTWAKELTYERCAFLCSKDVNVGNSLGIFRSEA